jgi:hypothetical protein
MKCVTLEQIKEEEKRLMEQLNGKNYREVPSFSDSVKYYRGLIIQYNAQAMLTACDKPYKDKFPEKPISHAEFITKFEKDRLAAIKMLESQGYKEYKAQIKGNIFNFFKAPITNMQDVLRALG